jgi:hypothetical protein
MATLHGGNKKRTYFFAGIELDAYEKRVLIHGMRFKSKIALTWYLLPCTKHIQHSTGPQRSFQQVCSATNTSEKPAASQPAILKTTFSLCLNLQSNNTV